jgi:hypothetical protein
MDKKKNDSDENVIHLEELFEAKKRLNEVLSHASPGIKEYQRRIDQTLRKAGKNTNNRLVFLSLMVRDNQIQLKNALHELSTKLTRQQDMLKKLADQLK